MSTLTPSRVPAREPRSRRRHPAHRGHATAAWLLIAPALIGFVVFAVYPTVRGTYFSFTTYHILSPAEWTGLANFRQMLGDQTFWHSLRATLYFVVLSVAIGILVSLVTAVVLHRLTRSTVIRGLVILPFLISGVVAAVIWSWMLDPQLGIVNVAIKAVTGQRVEFLGSSALAIPSVALISVWKSMGYNAVLIFAGLQTIPGEIYEAARLDGASEMRMFRHITVPLLRPILAMVVILSVISSIQVFDIVQVATKGGPANASNVLQMYIYDTAFSQYNFGYASAMSLALFAMLTAITFIQLRVTRANESDTN
ncbi:sugar ABC transporter permease [Streptomyces sp. NPDC006638]|uniref:carbohydrate ABC transporter permease n=1 Tax=unclassified Streptomyces TaxID=2593676 RepID=UPI0033B52797